MFYRKGILENFAKLTGKHLCQSLFFNKASDSAQVFSCEFWKISKNIFFYRTPPVAASEMISNDFNDKRNDVTNPQEMEMEERKKEMEERQLK